MNGFLKNILRKYFVRYLVIHANSSLSFHKGLWIHRDLDLPACYGDGANDIIHMAYMKRETYHRIGKPAIILQNGITYNWEYGKRILDKKL